MRSCFVDTSAFYAVLDASDRYHPRAAKRWASLLDEGADLVTTNYVLLETVALLQGRLGLEAVRVFTDDVQPLLRVEWLKEGDHRNAAEALILAGRKNLSLVDYTSFQVMRARGLEAAFTCDRHFRDMGFECLL